MFTPAESVGGRKRRSKGKGKRTMRKSRSKRGGEMLTTYGAPALLFAAHHYLKNRKKTSRKGKGKKGKSRKLLKFF